MADQNKKSSDAAYDKMMGNPGHKSAPLTDKMMKDMMPFFVDEDKPDDHKCGGCSMRIMRDGDRGDCTVVEGGISMKDGVCLYWAKGPASTYEDRHNQRMNRHEGDYVESKGKINCATCKFENKGECELWMGSVKPGQCCISWVEIENHDGPSVSY